MKHNIKFIKIHWRRPCIKKHLEGEGFGENRSGSPHFKERGKRGKKTVVCLS
jgi:hypothetical protein